MADKLNNTEVIHILHTALLCFLYDHYGDRMDEANAIGVVHKCHNHEKREDEFYIIKFDLKDGYCTTWGIERIPNDKYKSGDIIYYHDTQEDVVTYAALHGDIAIDE